MRILVIDEQDAQSELTLVWDHLEDILFELAAKWGETEDPDYIKQYHSVMETLFLLGWNGYVDVDSALPEEDMPEVYKDRSLIKTLRTSLTSEDLRGLIEDSGQETLIQKLGKVSK